MRHNYLAALLHSLLVQSYTNWDLLILDNNDDPFNLQRDHLVMAILTRIKFSKHNVQILRPTNPDDKTNIGKSRNILIEVDKNKYGCRIDDDSILHPDYIHLLWETMRSLHYDGCRAVGGVVPTYQSPELYKYPPKIFNQIKRTPVPERYLMLSKKYPELEGFKDENEEYYNIGEPIDDGAFYYHPDYAHFVPSHHLRSSYLFDNSSLRDIGGFPSSDDTGFREETIASIKLLEKGYKLYTHTQAIAWHLWSPSLSRGYKEGYSPEDHEKKILKNEITFQRGYRELLRKLFGKRDE
jgi:glycosyltransferase involved in cell wall biosynthesis